MKYKAIITDLDDTLLKSDHTIDLKVINAIKNYQKCGGLFAINTGRMVDAVRQILAEYGLTAYIIGCNGGVLTHSEIDYNYEIRTISWSDAYNLLVLEEEDDIPLRLYANGKIYCDFTTQETMRYEASYKAKVYPVNGKLSEFVKKEKISPYKILAVVDPEKTMAFIEKYSKIFPNEFNFTRSKPQFFEANSKNADKGLMALELIKRNGIDATELICMGDSDNDVSMLKVAGLPVAVENGRDSVKSLAKFICASNDDNGMLKVIELALSSN